MIGGTAIELGVARTAEPVLVDDPDVWDAWIAASSRGHLLQSFAWGECKRQFGWSVERIALIDGGECLAAAQVLWRPTLLGPVAYLPLGPVFAQPDPALERQLLTCVHQRLRRRRTVFVRVEPNQAEPLGLDAHDFTRAPATVQADVTIHVDLGPDLDALLAAAKPKTRYNIRLAQRRGVEVSSGTFRDLPDFYRLLQETSRRDQFFIRPFAYYQTVFASLGEKVRLLLAHHEGELLAAAFVTFFGPEAIYLYGASSDRRRNLMPTYLLQWEAIKLAKVLGCARYDFWGIPALVDPETGRPLDPEASIADLGVTGNGLWGVYRFKQGFGGRVVGYDGAWDYVYSPGRYRLLLTLLPAVRRIWSRRAG
ncbi:MAG TPA: peptidoglycan bridge formation glycyltransferase FemA/FemB family protein [Dehalococcoidia bacterium]|nr:peptidoglycan bridge formation glycyltransferase FemA/FemB family protein [Dehalococcoidia bacterium]